jgi:hypothetical protein
MSHRKIYRRNRLNRKNKNYHRYRINNIVYLHNIIIAAICEYLLDQEDCERLILVLNVNSDQYKHLYTVYNNPNTCPKNAMYIDTDLSFNDKISSMPSNLRTIKFYGDFNQEIYAWSSKLTHIRLSASYNKPLHNLPETLIKIYVDEDYVYLNDLKNMLGNKVVVRDVHYYNSNAHFIAHFM